ncbi:DUF3307 domain-containing protein [Pseudooceanicola nanhaiensis]|uniref:DUF3307 domain-containing protein n=1 Tax=Pseudooceanicola nanhaiensis TaxID=375761 RepID=UPI001CD5CC48|nr:DUF3307 domain-containing protein [Pseudooceanicola nanhaiensis]MCA0920906.1 DUF3307 domain-containing protein [Pseudooceanicola nanhaiensis]
MIETFAALLFAHVIADFVLQTNWIAQNKARPLAFLLHGLLVLIAAQAATGHWDAPALLILTGLHLAIDAGKLASKSKGLAGYLWDQAAHLVTLVAVAWLWPDLWSSGLWAGASWLLPLMTVLAGAVLSVRAGEFAVGLLMRPHAMRVRNNGLRNGGRLIGQLERGMIYALILLNQPLGVGFLVAAKSILRFGTATRDQRTAEYVIIGTLASFLWAILVAYGSAKLLSVLPPLEIGAQ